MDVYTLLFGYGMPWTDGLLGVAMFGFFGFAVAWRNARAMPLVAFFLAQFVYGTLALRYALSYLVWHHTLREGMWPVAWVSAAIVGVHFAARSNRAH